VGTLVSLLQRCVSCWYVVMFTIDADNILFYPPCVNDRRFPQVHVSFALIHDTSCHNCYHGRKASVSIRISVTVDKNSYLWPVTL
jgi:hypothetical protein